MTQRDRDRLVVLKKAQKYLITQKQAGEELGISDRQVRRLIVGMNEIGDQAVMHRLRGRPSNRKLSEELRCQAVAVLSQEVYRGFGPTLASEYLAKKHKLRVGREALRQLMIGAGLWRAQKQKIEAVHEWRPRKHSCGEMVQWDTSEHDCELAQRTRLLFTPEQARLIRVQITAIQATNHSRIDETLSTK